jgi:hypothetical protein
VLGKIIPEKSPDCHMTIIPFFRRNLGKVANILRQGSNED